MDFYKHVLENKTLIIEKTKEILRIPSVLTEFDPESETPFGVEINRSLHYMLDLAKADSFVTKNVKNYAAHIEYGEGKEILGILCHIDVVPAGDNWSHPPFSPIIKKDKIYARGSSDDKGPTIAAYYALRFLKDLGVKMDKRVRIIIGTDEETGWRGIDEYFKTEEMPEIGFAPDASFPLIYGEKGILSFDVTGKTEDEYLLTFKAGDRYNVVPDYAECTLSVDLKDKFKEYLLYNGLNGEVKDDKYIVHGKRAHAMQPNLGINAAFILAEFLNENINNQFIKYICQFLTFDHLGEKLNINHHDDEMKDFTINPAVYEYQDNKFKIGINCRYPKGWDKDSALINIEASVIGPRFKFKVLNDSPVHYVDKEDELVKTLHNAYIKHTGDDTTPIITIGGGTYSRALKKAVAFGATMPGRKDVAHQIDEFVHIEDLLKATAIYMEAIYQLAGIKE